MSIGATSPPAIMRTEALPEADTPSYCPVRISVTISSEVLATFAFTWHWVSCSNGVTQSTLLSVEPSSAYPGQTTMLSLPSPAPIEFDDRDVRHLELARARAAAAVVVAAARGDAEG